MFSYFRVNTTDFNQDTPLHASLLYHNTENTKILLQHGADLTMTNAIGRRPIHNANDSESLDLLIDHGADINAKDTNGKYISSQMVITRNELTNCTFCLICHFNLGNTSLHYAVLAKDMDRVKTLVTRNCDINIANSSG